MMISEVHCKCEISSHMYSFSNANFRFTIEGLTVRSIPAIETTIITKDYGTSTVNILR